ncbi:MAG: glycosyltransferase, partial [Pseudomonadota bacterium]
MARPKLLATFATASRRFAWHVLLLSANLLFLNYLFWRVDSFLTAPQLNVLSPVLLVLEGLCFIGFVLYSVNLWDIGAPTPRPPNLPAQNKSVDIFITTYSEPVDVVLPTIRHAKSVLCPEHLEVRVVLLDDWHREAMRWVAEMEGIDYITRSNNLGYKAGNLANGLEHSTADLFVICDADTHLAPNYLIETEPYLRDPTVAWVQVPHRFRDTPMARLPKPLHWIKWSDPMFTNPAVFFEILQKGRNADHASFCCGAGSIHCRHLNTLGRISVTEDTGLPARFTGRARLLPPFAHHVSEDIYTSYRLHFRKGPKIKSILLDRPLATMSAVQDLNAWAIQNFKYAAGTLDIFAREVTRFRFFDRPLARLYYLMTFWSYLSLLW